MEQRASKLFPRNRSTIFKKIGIPLVFVMLGLAFGLSAQTPVDVVGTAFFSVKIDGDNLSIPYFSNFSPEIANAGVKHAVIVIHGPTETPMTIMKES